MSLAALKTQLGDRLIGDRLVRPTSFDAVLGDGVPRGRLTEILGPLGAGRTTVVRRVVESVIAAGLPVAYVDATRTLDPRAWVHLGDGFRVVRPPAPARGAWCADVLLRSGGFGLVVLDGAPPLARPVALRLVALAREQDVALVVSGEQGAPFGAALRIAVARPPAHRSNRRSRTIVVAVEKGGNRQRGEVSCAIDVASRLCAHPEVRDRRGGGRGGRYRGGR